ncbi:MAG: hypothetical protein EAZ51_06805 [Sphingobacteriales bacterium]|nr:MAG: hypothetical protein EAZ64_08385 [Sphingobacteriales bacterium]TAF80004.1 MAG: hypothetical protein EAZ51_06805 [Sphingobacteriales bacterium]
MKPTLTLVIALLFGKVCLAYDIDKIRLDYIAAVNSSKKTNILYNELKAIAQPDALILAYLGSAEALRAKHAFNPINKLAYLKQGSITLAKAVETDPNNIEVRFLRFSLEHYVPSFLGYNKNLEADKAKIIQLLQHKNKAETTASNHQITKNIIRFLLETKRCNLTETALLKKIYP